MHALYRQPSGLVNKWENAFVFGLRSTNWVSEWLGSMLIMFLDIKLNFEF